MVRAIAFPAHDTRAVLVFASFQDIGFRVLLIVHTTKMERCCANCLPNVSFSTHLHITINSASTKEGRPYRCTCLFHRKPNGSYPLPTSEQMPVSMIKIKRDVGSTHTSFPPCICWLWPEGQDFGSMQSQEGFGI